MKHTLTDGKQIYYEYDLQNNQYQTVVFLNGLSQSTLSWKSYAEKLHKNFNVLLVDSIFQGQSDKTGESRSFDQHAADLKSLLDALGLQKIHLIGISYGGAVAMRLMANHTDFVQKAVLMSTFAHKTSYFEQVGYGWQKAVQAGGYPLMFDVMLPMVLGKFYVENPLIPLESMRNFRSGINENADALVKLMQATSESGDYRPNLRKIKIPTLIIHGKDDILTTPEMGKEIAKALENSEFVLLKQKGHTLNVEAIEETIELISNFLMKN
ncbi:MAG: alpha/beta hydrolase [Bacteroidetes bacterium]|nr:MAG: alpha/beta hydrolase [Bacteroidota bacterium]